MSPEEITTASSVRSKYAFLYSCIAELYRFRYGKKTSTKVEEIKQAVNVLKNDNYISDYISENLANLFEQYKTLVPGNSERLMQIDRSAEIKRLCCLSSLVDDQIKEVCAEISQVIDDDREHYMKMYLLDR